MLRTILVTASALALVAGAATAQSPPGVAPGAPAATARPPRAPTPAEYAERPKARGPAYDLAVEAALEAINFCKSKGQDISVQVTDSANEPVVMISPNTAGMRSLRLLKPKAVSVYRTAKPSSQTRALMEADPVLAVWGANDGATLFPGAVPIFVGGEMIGAITVSGSRINNDEECSQAGLNKIQSRLK